jgi:hypothetical protein
MKVLFGFVFLLLSVLLVIFQMASYQNPEPYFIQHSRLFIVFTVISLFCASMLYAGKKANRSSARIGGSIALLVCLASIIFMIHNITTSSTQIISHGYIVFIIYAVIFGYYGYSGVSGG